MSRRKPPASAPFAFDAQPDNVFSLKAEQVKRLFRDMGEHPFIAFIFKDDQVWVFTKNCTDEELEYLRLVLQEEEGESMTEAGA